MTVINGVVVAKEGKLMKVEDEEEIGKRAREVERRYLDGK